ncbi:MAG TPA: hypothetical protein VGF48_17870 [Thermoanaerobaculia bacterium]|jgi:hypothetical protein
MALDAKCTALAVLLMIAGCSGGPAADQATTRVPEPATTAAPRTPAPAVRVPLLPSGGASHLVGAIGVLEVDGPCLYLRASNGSRILPAFATANTRWSESQGWLEVGERTFRPGQTVRLSGSPVKALSPTLPWVQAPDPGCAASSPFIAYAIDANE